MPIAVDAPLPPGLSDTRTLAELLRWRVALTPDAEAYRSCEPGSADWRSLSWREIGARIDHFAAALTAADLPVGARVAILLPNGVDAVCIDQASLATGCVPVPMHAIDNPASIAYILRDSDASLLVTQSEAQWQAIAAVGEALPALRQVVVVQPGEATADDAPGGVPVLTLDRWLAQASHPSGTTPANRPAPGANDLAAIVYTSGTTGNPKGLTHENVLSNVKAVCQRIAPQSSDVFLSFLPLSHTFERTAGYYLPIAAGCCVAYARSTSLLAEDLLTVRPTILVSVPRIYERVHAGVQALLADSPLKQRLFAWAQAVGWRRFCRAQGLPMEGDASALTDALAWPLLNRLVARTLLDRFGGRLRVAVSGGAPLSQAIAHTFLGLGLPIVQGYGMTESSPVVAVNTPGDNDPATIGRPLAGVEVRIGENKELLVRGPNVMRGYLNREEDTAKTVVDGWLRTGDQAAIDDGRIRILGRVKEIIVTSTGEKIAPADLELAIAADPLFEQVYVLGDDRPFIASIAVLGRAPWARLAATLQLDPDQPDSLRSPAAREAALARIRDLTRSFPHYAQPRAVWLTTEPWTVENTMLTPTLKLKRRNLANRFAAEIEEMYRR